MTTDLTIRVIHPGYFVTYSANVEHILAIEGLSTGSAAADYINNNCYVVSSETTADLTLDLTTQETEDEFFRAIVRVIDDDLMIG